MKGKTKKLLNNTMLFLLGSIGSKFIQFFLVPLYTYTLTSEEYGLTDLIFTTINFLMPFFSLRLADTLLRFGLDKNIKKEDTIETCFKLLFFSSFLSFALSPFLLFIPSFKPYIIPFVLILNLQIYRDIISIIAKIYDKNKLYASDSILYTLVLCISNVLFLVFLKKGINGYLYSYVIANVLSILFLLLNLHLGKNVIRRNTDKKLMRQMLIYSVPMIVNSVSYWITAASDRYMIGLMLNVSLVGIYAVATKVPTIITTFTGIFNQAWMISSISEYENDRDIQFYSFTFRTYFSMSIIACAFLLIIIKPFMSIYVNADYYIAWQSTAILILSAVFSGICAFLNGIFYAYKKSLEVTVTTIIGAFFNILLNLLLIPKFELIGAAIATAFSWFIIMTVRLITIQKFLPLNFRKSNMICQLLIVIIECMSLYFYNNILCFLLNVCFFIFICYLNRQTLYSLSSFAKKKFMTKFHHK